MTSNKIPLYGFNNLTKNLSFSLYRVHYLASEQAEEFYHSFINQSYNSKTLSSLLTKVCHAIGGNVLNIASQDYTPQGASVTLMISEEAKPESLVAHLDKSHLCIHTYPEENSQNGIAIFRADVELSTCGVISPLKVLDYVIDTFSADVVDIDYRIRGMTRDQQGGKLYNDQNVKAISEHLSQSSRNKYTVCDSVLALKNLYHCNLVKQGIDIEQHLVNPDNIIFNAEEKKRIQAKITAELQDLFLSR